MRSLGTIRDLAGGRLPPLTRTALVAGLVVFLITLALVRPTDGGLPPVEPVRGGVRWLGKGNGSAEAAVLLDPSVAYMPARLVGTSDVSLSGPKPTEGTPFPRLDRMLSNDPLKSDEPPLKVGEPSAPSLASAVPLTQAEPYITLGRVNLAQSSIPSRAGAFEVFSLSGERKAIISGIMPHLDINNDKINSKNSKSNPLWSVFEATFGIDSLGLQGPPALARSSGDLAVDRAILRWTKEVPWARHLPPGSYRLTVVP